jgi:hypothetical protein
MDPGGQCTHSTPYLPSGIRYRAGYNIDRTDHRRGEVLPLLIRGMNICCSKASLALRHRKITLAFWHGRTSIGPSRGNLTNDWMIHGFR